jgi:hypothetical protein
MKKKVLTILTVVMMAVLSVVAIAPGVSAANYVCSDGPHKGELKTADTHDNAVAKCNDAAAGYTEQEEKLMGTMTNIINIIIGIVGFITVLMIIIGGIMYATSAGDAGKVKKAKDTIMYGLIGLVIAILAFAIVNFVLGGIQTPASTGP